MKPGSLIHTPTPTPYSLSYAHFPLRLSLPHPTLTYLPLTSERKSVNPNSISSIFLILLSPTPTSVVLYDKSYFLFFIFYYLPIADTKNYSYLHFEDMLFHFKSCFVFVYALCEALKSGEKSPCLKFLYDTFINDLLYNECLSVEYHFANISYIVSICL